MDVNERLRRLKLGLPTADRIFIPLDAGLNGAASELSKWMADNFNHNFDAYDSAIDAVYNQTHIGGSSLHHLLDGQHSFLGAIRAVHDVKPDDSFVQEISQATEHLLRDTASVSGINPFFSLSAEQFDSLAGLCAPLGVSRPFLADALTINGPELLGGLLGLTGCIIAARVPDPGALSTLSGAYIVSAAASANPFLIPIAAAGLAYSLYNTEDRRTVLVDAGKGSLVSGGAILISSLVGGPVWLGCLAGVGAAVAIRYSLDHPDRVIERVKSLVSPASNILRQAALETKYPLEGR